MNTEKFNQLVKESRYKEMGDEFLSMTGTDMKVIYERTGKYFDDDKDVRDVYRIVLSRNNRQYAFSFGQSVHNSGKYLLYGKSNRGIAHREGSHIKIDWLSDYEEKQRGFINPFRDWELNKNYEVPDAYSVLACLTKYSPGTFEDFCSEYGYDTDSKKAEKTYQAVKDEYTNLCTLYNDEELELMCNIA